MGIESLIAQFGQNTGAPIAAGINRGIERRDRNRLAELARQERQGVRDAQAAQQREKAEEEYTRAGVEAILSAAPDQREGVFNGFRQGAQQRGFSLDGVPEQWSDEHLPSLMGFAGAKAPTGKDSQRRIVKGADGFQYYADNEERVLPNVEGKPGGGAFEGTGIEAQMLNIVLNPDIPDNHPTKILARQRLEKETTTVTPEGTYIRPGYDLSQLQVRPPQPTAQTVEQTEVSGTPDAPAVTTTRTQFVEKPATDGEKLSAGFYDRMDNAEREIKTLLDKNPSFSPASGIEAGKAGLSNYLASSQYQQYRQAADDWIRAKLRKESGANIPPEEMQQEYENYFPMPGDRPEVVAQKARAREVANQAMRRAAGRAYEEPEAADNDPLGIR